MFCCFLADWAVQGSSENLSNFAKVPTFEGGFYIFPWTKQIHNIDMDNCCFQTTKSLFIVLGIYTFDQK